MSPPTHVSGGRTLRVGRVNAGRTGVKTSQDVFFGGRKLPFVIAHRGSAKEAPENTLRAFSDAGRLGATWVELDVRRTADGALAVHHDRLVPGAGPVDELLVADLPAHVPLLEEALDACDGMGVVVEVKAGPADPEPLLLAAAVAAHVAERLASVPGQPLLVSSFNPAVLQAVTASEPAVPVALLWLPGFDPVAAVDLACSLGCAAVHPHQLAVDRDLVARAHDLGLRVDTWTVNDPHRMREVADAGVDGVMTDEVALAVEVLGRPG